MNVWRKADIEMATRDAIKCGLHVTKDLSEAINIAIDKLFERFGNLSEQELNIVRNVLAQKIDQYTKQFEMIGK